MPEPQAIPKILAALLSVAREVKYVKRETVPQAGTGVLRDVVVSEVRPILLKAGIITMTTQLDGRLEASDKTNSKGTPLTVYVGKYRTTFIHSEDASSLFVDSEAIGHDYGDKAAGKARTYAEKMNLIGGLMLETGINDEGRLPDAGLADDEVPQKRLPPDALELLKALISHAKNQAELKAAKVEIRKALAKAEIPDESSDRVALNEALASWVAPEAE